MSGRASQRKGRTAELQLAEVLRQAGFPSVEVGAPLSYGRWPDVAGLEGVHVEVKRCERLELGAWMRQAVEDAGRFGGLPAVFHRQNRGGWVVSMRLYDWLELYRKGVVLGDRETENPTEGSAAGAAATDAGASEGEIAVEA